MIRPAPRRGRASKRPRRDSLPASGAVKVEIAAGGRSIAPHVGEMWQGKEIHIYVLRYT